jgi:ribosomal protein S18 acetylase RimI-like enzyme
MPIEFRSVTTADLPDVRSALIETWHATYDNIYGAEKVADITSRWHSIATLAAQRHAPKSAFYVALRDRAVLGSSFALEVEPGIVHLHRLYVRPIAQGSGVGRALMAATFAVFPDANRHRLEVEPKNFKAIHFYQREGFSKRGEVADCGNGSGVAASVFERLAPESGRSAVI